MGSGVPPSSFSAYEMLAAQPPTAPRRLGTRKDMFRMCSWSGRICSAKRPSKPMMVSKARDPQMTAAMVSFVGSGIEGKQPVARDARAARHGEHDAKRACPFAAGGDGLTGSAQLGRRQHA